MDFELVFLLYPFMIFIGNDVVKCEPRPGKYTDSGIFDSELKDKRMVNKRYGVNLDSCSSNFAVHRDKIIRTEDSIKMGAKYLSASDVLSRDDCLRICCQTDTCNVFVFEEKTPGTCYLFNCGSPDDFKCNFTHHHNYSSAVLTVNRPLIELESQIPHSQHEEELLRLRKPEAPIVQIVETTTPIAKKGSKEILPTVIEFGSPVAGSKCSRNQFECHSSGECLAIYNACDGIPQCPDGSDEAPELGCPTTAPPTSAPVVSSVKSQPSVENLGFIPNKAPQHVDVHADKSGDPVRPFVSGPMNMMNQQQIAWQQQMYNNPNVNMMPNNAEQQGLPIGKTPEQLLNQAKTYGREGENFQWQESMPKGDMHIFTHKGGLMTNYQPPESVNPMNGQQYGEISSSKINYYNNVGFNHLQQQPQPMQPNWHRKAIPPEINVNAGSYDYFYEDPRARLQQQAQAQSQAHPNNINNFQHQPAHFQETQDVGSIYKPARRPADSVKKANPVDILFTTEMPSSTTLKHKIHSHHTHHKPPASHRKVEKFGAEPNLKIFEEDVEEKSVPSGAILSLTLGLLVTALMVVIVGCRMRVIRRRLRRGGKSGYSHDADFLVNGMYL